MFGSNVDGLVVDFFQEYFDTLVLLSGCRIELAEKERRIAFSERYLESLSKLEKRRNSLKAEFSKIRDKQTFDRFWILFGDMVSPLKDPEAELFQAPRMVLPKSLEKYLEIENNLAFYLNYKNPRLGYLLERIFAIYRTISSNLYLAYGPVVHKDFDKLHAKALRAELKALLKEFRELMKEAK